MRPRLSLIAIAVGTAAVVAGLASGCGSSGSSTSASGGTTTSTTASAGGGPATVAVADNSKLGEILVDAKGRTLYQFEKDESDESYCNGGCTKVWPPYMTSGSPKAAKGASASKLGTVKRDDGTTQVSYNGHPLYTYVDDSKPGEASGNELDQFGAEWYALHPNGENAESKGGGDES